MAFDSTNIRVAIYNCDLQLVKNNLPFGVGFNNIQQCLNECYNSNYNAEFYKEVDYLSHNYFFYIFISSGILGFLGLLIFFFYLFKTVLRINTFMIYVVILNVSLMCFIEDFFFRQFGLFSFLMLFFANYKNHEQNELMKKVLL